MAAVSMPMRTILRARPGFRRPAEHLAAEIARADEDQQIDAALHVLRARLKFPR